MNISEPFIRKPVATTLLVVAITLAGHGVQLGFQLGNTRSGCIGQLLCRISCDKGCGVIDAFHALNFLIGH